MSAVAISEAVQAGRLTATAAIERALNACANENLNAVTSIFVERAKAKAREIDTRPEKGSLAGVPFAVKNIFDVAGHVTRAGSAATGGNAPACEDAFAIAALEKAGAVLVAAANMDELAYGFSGENAHDGDTINPRRSGLSAGGSSSGSAALVAAGALPLALGTDTNGSVRVPAALSGAVGLKPGYGRISRRGVHPFVPSLDHVGLFTADIADARLVFEVLDQFDPLDPVATQGTSVEIEHPRAARLHGWFSGPLQEDVRHAVDDACRILEAKETATLELAEEARAASFVLTNAEGGQTHLSALASQPENFGALVRHRLTAGAMVPAAWTARAQRLRRMVSNDLAALHEAADILIAPATPCPAFPLGVAEHDVAGHRLPIRLAIGMFTQALTLTGVPILVLARQGQKEGLPVGVQLIGNTGSEATLLRAGSRLEAAGFSIDPVEGVWADV